jgi:hypothetical protein
MSSQENQAGLYGGLPEPGEVNATMACELIGRVIGRRYPRTTLQARSDELRPRVIVMPSGLRRCWYQRDVVIAFAHALVQQEIADYSSKRTIESLAGQEGEP